MGGGRSASTSSLDHRRVWKERGAGLSPSLGAHDNIDLHINMHTPVPLKPPVQTSLSGVKRQIFQRRKFF